MSMGKRESSEPTCPFCKGPLPRPSEKRLSETEIALIGRCGGCGSFFIVDPTGKNVGEVMMQGLQVAAEELGKDPATLVSGRDYQDEILSYDLRIHRSPGVPQGFMDGNGRLYIIKVIKE